MNIVSRTALSNFKKNKSRNILIGAAIALTALLLTVAPTVIAGYINIQNQAVGEIYPTYHVMFRDVDSGTSKELLADERVEQAGFREDVAMMYCDDKDISISMMSIDRTAAELARQELSAGRFPEKADEIVVSDGILEAMELKGAIGDRIEIPFHPAASAQAGDRQNGSFVIVGMTEDNDISRREGIYFAFVSDAFSKEILQEDAHKYRIYLRMNDIEGMVTDQIKEQIGILGEEYGIEKRCILTNGTYLSANYVDSATYKGLAVMMAVISIVGVLTIYSIYYVSMLDKVQEYGKLRAIGATKRQIRQMVFREGLAVAVIAIPIGIILGLVTGVLLIKISTSVSAGRGNIIFDEMKRALDQHKVKLVLPWVIGCSALVSLATVYISLLRPMQTAAKISAIEAIRYQGNRQSKKKSRKGYEEINIKKLTITNLERNKRRTAMTVLTLGATGVLFMIAATICSCMDPEVLTRQEIREDIQISVDAYGDEEMYPERTLRKIQQDNPLTEELKEEILRIDGVKAVDIDRAVSAGLEGVEEDDGRPLQTGINGISGEALRRLRNYVTDGSLDDPALMKGEGVILGERFRNNFSEMADWQVGTQVWMQIADGEKDIRKEFRIVALVDGPSSLGGTYLSMPADVLQNLCETDLTDSYEITVEDGKEAAAASEIEALIAGQEFLEMKTYENVYEEEERGVRIIMYGCYGLLLVFGLIGLLNLVNTMINSVYVRRKELGMLQAVGMSGRQTVGMLQMEGMFYTTGTLLISLGLGSVLGYAVFLWAKKEGLMAITAYQYPVIPAIVLAAAVLAVQILIIYLVNYNFKKQSLIDRIRFAE